MSIKVEDLDGYKIFVRDGVRQICPWTKEFCSNRCPLLRIDVRSGELNVESGVSVGCGNPNGEFYPYED